MQEALGHYRALGHEAPAHLARSSSKKPGRSRPPPACSITLWVKTWRLTFAADRPHRSRVQRASSSLGRAVVEDAGHMVHLSQKTGLSIAGPAESMGKSRRKPDRPRRDRRRRRVQAQRQPRKAAKQGARVREALTRLRLNTYDHPAPEARGTVRGRSPPRCTRSRCAQERNRLGVDPHRQILGDLAPAVVEGLRLNRAEDRHRRATRKLKAIDAYAAHRCAGSVSSTTRRTKGALAFAGEHGPRHAQPPSQLIAEAEQAVQLRPRRDSRPTINTAAQASRIPEALAFITSGRTDRHTDVLLKR